MEADKGGAAEPAQACSLVSIVSLLCCSYSLRSCKNQDGQRLSKGVFWFRSAVVKAASNPNMAGGLCCCCRPRDLRRRQGVDPPEASGIRGAEQVQLPDSREENAAEVLDDRADRRCSFLWGKTTS